MNFGRGHNPVANSGRVLATSAESCPAEGDNACSPAPRTVMTIFSLSRRMLPETQFVSSPGVPWFTCYPQLLPNRQGKKKKQQLLMYCKQCSLFLNCGDCFPVIRKHFSPSVRQHLFPCSGLPFSQSFPVPLPNLAITSELHKLVSLLTTHRSVWPVQGYMSSRKGTVNKPNQYQDFRNI